MEKVKQRKLQQWWIITVLVTIVLFAVYSLLKNNLLQNEQTPAHYNSNNSVAKISKEEAVAKVNALPEIIDYLKRVPNGLVLVNGEEDNAYLVQVYEFKNDHTATFNWYTVNKTTGKVKKEF